MTDSDGLINWLIQHPEIMALLVVAMGWITATLIRLGLASAIARLNRVSLRWGTRPGPLLSAQFTRILQLMAYWGILLAAFVLGFSLLGDGKISGWFDYLGSVISHILVALTIVAIGHILGVVARRLVSGLARSTGVKGLTSAVYAFVLGTALLTAVNHLGLDITFITRLALVLISIFLIGLALAFGIGARTLVANLSAQGELNRYKEGDRIRADDVEGVVVEISRTGVVLATAEGFAHVPASRFAETTIISLRNDPGEDG